MSHQQHIGIPDADDTEEFEVDRVYLRGSSIWFAIGPHDWLLLCELAKGYGWAQPPARSESTKDGGWTFTVQDESAAELAKALEKIRADHTDRQLRDKGFRKRGWKNRLASLVTFFQSGGVAVYVRAKAVRDGDRVARPV